VVAECGVVALVLRIGNGVFGELRERWECGVVWYSCSVFGFVMIEGIVDRKLLPFACCCRYLLI